MIVSRFTRILFAAFAILAFGSLNAAPLSTAFTYQGNLSDNGSLANGDYDFEFELWNHPSVGGQIGITVPASNVTVADGIFTVDLDFGAAAFLGDDLWLRILVGSTGGGLTELLPRQAVTPAPFALHAESVPPGSITNQEIDTGTVQARIINTCTVGQYIQEIDPAGNLTCVTETDPVYGAWDKSSGISITESQVSDLSHTVDTDTTYTAGTGLDLTSTTFNVDSSTVQTRVGGTCGPGTYLSGINQDGSVLCETLNWETPASTFKDCPQCPLMINIPGGSFDMGQTGVDNATPVHTVTVPAFAMGVYEVTFDEWDACVTATGCAYTPGDEGWGRGTRPVINVSWDDIQIYIAWLNSTTSGGYRLPSESEWEYATRAGTVTDYWFGDPIGVNQANCSGGSCGDSFPKTAPAHTYSANPFGLYNVHGNVYEWVEDCWHNDYTDAPPDPPPLNGDPWTVDCDIDPSMRVRRGGSWSHTSEWLRSASRFRSGKSQQFYSYGFRIAKD